MFANDSFDIAFCTSSSVNLHLLVQLAAQRSSSNGNEGGSHRGGGRDNAPLGKSSLVKSDTSVFSSWKVNPLTAGHDNNSPIIINNY